MGDKSIDTDGALGCWLSSGPLTRLAASQDLGVTEEDAGRVNHR